MKSIVRVLLGQTIRYSTNPNMTVATKVTTFAVIGRLDEFQLGKDDFNCYIERMEQYFVANEVPQKKNVAAFLTAIGGPTYKLLRNLVTPETPKEKTLAELKSVFHSHLKPKPLMIAEHFEFHNRSQQEVETVAEYIIALKELSTHCTFGDFLRRFTRSPGVWIIQGVHTKEVTFRARVNLHESM